MQQGYYSLIQYCPDWTKLEVCNIGVMLFCPGIRFLDVKMTGDDSKRVRSIFGKQHRLNYIRTFKGIFANRILRERDNLLDLNALKYFIANRANSFLITEPRSIAVDDPKKELDNLFEEVFGRMREQENEKHTSVKEQLDKILEVKLGAQLSDRVLKNPPSINLSIPGFRKAIRPCVAFYSGVFNFVVERKLTPTNSFSKMSSDMIMGRFVAENEDKQWGKRRLIVLADVNGDVHVKQQIGVDGIYWTENGL